MRKAGKTNQQFKSIYDGREVKTTNDLVALDTFTIAEYHICTSKKTGTKYTALVTNEQPTIVYNVSEMIGRDLDGDDTYSTKKEYTVELHTSKSGRPYFVIAEV